MSDTPTGTVRPAFPALIDNTMRSAFRTCPTKLRIEFLEGWVPSMPSIHLHAGGAFAHGLEVARREFYENKKDAETAKRLGIEATIRFYGPIELPQGKTGDKSLENVLRAFDSYLNTYRLGEDACKPYMLPNGKAMVEFAFSMPTKIAHPVTGDPILYGGRADMIGVMRDVLWVTDEKTASALGEQWQKNWKMDSQFTGYIAAAKNFGFPVAGALIRGVGLLKTKITHAEALVMRSEWEIARWWDQLHYDIERMIDNWRRGYWDMALDKGACNAYGGCPNEMLCSSPDPAGYLPLYFRQRIWNPLEKDSGEKLLENPELVKALAQPELHVPELDALLAGRKPA